MHRAKGIKILISIQAIFDVLDGVLPGDFTWTTLSLAVDGIYPLVVTRGVPEVCIHMCAFACAF